MFNKMKKIFIKIIVFTMVIFIVLENYTTIGYAVNDDGVDGCHHNGTIFADGSLVPTMEPCLSCKCLAKNLICSLRVCPEQLVPPPRGCLLIHRKGNCCPQLTCSKLNNKLSTKMPHNADVAVVTQQDRRHWYNNDADDVNSNSQERTNHRIFSKNTIYRKIEDDFDDDRVETDADNQMCIHNGTIYRSGSAMSTSSLCSYCYCIEGRQKCVRPKCLLASPGCEPIFTDSTCCPIRYDCHSNKLAQKNSITTKTSKRKSQNRIENKHYLRSQYRMQRSRGCLIASYYYPEGQKLPTDSSRPCEICFCIRGSRKCTPKKCSPAIRSCKPMIPAGQCCPSSYECEQSSRSLTDDPSSSARQFNLFSLFFGDEFNNDTSTTETGDDATAFDQTAYPKYPPEAISTTSEKSIFDAIREGLNFIDSNDKHVGTILDKTVNATTSVPNVEVESSSSSSSSSSDDFSFLDLLLGPDEEDDVGENSTVIEEGQVEQSSVDIPPASREEMLDFSSGNDNDLNNTTTENFVSSLYEYFYTNDDAASDYTTNLINYATSSATEDQFSEQNEQTASEVYSASTFDDDIEYKSTEKSTIESGSTTNLFENTSDGTESLLMSTSTPNIIDLTLSDITDESNIDLTGSDMTDETNDDLNGSDISDESSIDLKQSDVTDESKNDLNGSEVTGESKTDLKQSDVTTESNIDLKQSDVTDETNIDWTRHSDITDKSNIDKTQITNESNKGTTSFTDKKTSTENQLLEEKYHTVSSSTHVPSTTTVKIFEKTDLSSNEPEVNVKIVSTTTEKATISTDNKTEFQHLPEINESFFSSFFDEFSNIFDQIENKTNNFKETSIVKGSILKTTTLSPFTTEKLLLKTTSKLETTRPKESITVKTREPIQKVAEPIKTTTAKPITSTLKQKLPTKSPIVILTTTKSTPKIESAFKTTPVKAEILINSNPSILESDLNYDYSEPTLPPSLPNLKIIPFLPADAVKNNRNKVNYYTKNVPTIYPVLTENYENVYGLVEGKDNVEPPSISSSDSMIFDRIDDNSDYNYNNGRDKYFVSPYNSNAKIEYDENDYERTLYPSITEKHGGNDDQLLILPPHTTVYNISEKSPYPSYNNYGPSPATAPEYDYELYSKFSEKYNANKFLENSYEPEAPIIDSYVSASLENKDDPFTVDAKNHAIEFTSTQHPSLFKEYERINHFSPPSKTEGGFLPKKPIKDSYFYDSYDVTNKLLVDITTELPVVIKGSNNSSFIELTTTNPFKDVIHTEPPPNLLALIEDKEHFLQNLSIAKNNNYSSIVLATSDQTDENFDKDIISITTDTNYNLTSDYESENKENNSTKTAAEKLPSLKTATEATTTESLLNDIFGFLFENKKPTETTAIPPFRKISTTSLTLNDILNVTQRTNTSASKPASDIPQRKNNKITEYQTTEPMATPETKTVENLNILRDVLLATLNSQSSDQAGDGNYPGSLINVATPLFKPNVLHQVPFLSPIFPAQPVHNVESKNSFGYNPIRSELDLVIKGENKVNNDADQSLPEYSSISNQNAYVVNPVDIDLLKHHHGAKILSKPTAVSSPHVNGKNNYPGSVGLLKLAGCNIYGRMYRVGRIITELSGPCLECKCTEVGVHCTSLDC